MMRILGGNARGENMNLTLVNKSSIGPHITMEDVLVKVGTLVYHVDFVIINIEDEFKVHIILGILYLRNTRETFDLEIGELRRVFQKENMIIKVYDDLKLCLLNKRFQT